MQKDHKVFNGKIRLPVEIKKRVLAFGAHVKNTVCFASGRTAWISQVHPDLGCPRDLDQFETDVRRFLKKNPQIIACDLHPGYASTKYAHLLRTTDDGVRSIQHHHAHIASCMAENGLSDQRVIGVAFDGTGMGNDNTLWGAEFLICDYRSFRRTAHLRNIALLGGEAAIRQPWRVAAAWLYETYGEKFPGLNIGFAKKLNKKKWSVLRRMHDCGLNSVLASSMGRLWDAAASVIFGEHGTHNEAALAIKLQNLAERPHRVIAMHEVPKQSRFFEIASAPPRVVAGPRNDRCYIINPAPCIKEIVSNIKKNMPQEIIAYRFHLNIAEMVKEMCVILRREHAIDRVALSGGVFQNTLLLSMVSGLLYKEGFKVFTHKKLSCNDSGVSLGQAVIAGAHPAL